MDDHWKENLKNDNKINYRPIHVDPKKQIKLCFNTIIQLEQY